MLSRLTIQDVVLIDRLTIDFESGLTALTGETGAGKSILLDALGLALGARSEAGLVRKGSVQASVTAVFSPHAKHPAHKWLQVQDLPAETDLLLRRVIGADGKSRAYINDQPVSIGLLRQLGEMLVDVHGQFETHGLLDPASHRAFLDAFGGCEADVAATAADFAVWQEAQNALAAAQADLARAQGEQEFLRACVSELDRLKPQPGEEDQLADKRSRLQNAGKILDALSVADDALTSDKGADKNLRDAIRAVLRVTDKAGAEAADLLKTLESAADQVAEASAKLEQLQRALDLNPDALDQAEERLFALRACARKHQTTVAELPSLHTRLTERLNTLEGNGDTLGKLAKAAAAARNAYMDKARKLSARRQKAAKTLSSAVNAELPPLKLEKATMTAQVDQLPDEQANATGLDKIMFLASTNAGTAPAPMHKTASGGELARFMLALKVVLARTNPVPTLVFDEVDTGIGGATAMAVGERLSRLGEHLQVLVVTHSPQVAAKADQHLQVRKDQKAAKATTSVSRLEAAERREEIARMLAGSKVTDAARTAADSLLDEDAPTPAKRAKRA